jgi:hypothetical protein
MRLRRCRARRFRSAHGSAELRQPIASGSCGFHRLFRGVGDAPSDAFSIAQNDSNFMRLEQAKCALFSANYPWR